MKTTDQSPGPPWKQSVASRTIRPAKYLLDTHSNPFIEEYLRIVLENGKLSTGEILGEKVREEKTRTLGSPWGKVATGLPVTADLTSDASILPQGKPSSGLMRLLHGCLQNTAMVLVATGYVCFEDPRGKTGWSRVVL